MYGETLPGIKHWTPLLKLIPHTHHPNNACWTWREKEMGGREGGWMDCHWDDVSAAAGMDRCKSDCEMEMNESVQCIPLIPTYPKTIMVQTLQEWKWNTRTQANIPSEGDALWMPWHDSKSAETGGASPTSIFRKKLGQAPCCKDQLFHSFRPVRFRPKSMAHCLTRVG